MNDKRRVLVGDTLSEEGLVLFREAGYDVDIRLNLSPDALAEVIADYDALVVRSKPKVTASVFAREMGRMKVIGRAGIGVDNVDCTAARAAGVAVMNTPGGNTVTTAEHAIALMFALARHIPQATASMKSGRWEKSKFEGTELFNRQLGLVGLGNVGKIVADRALGLRMKVCAYDPFVSDETIRELGATPLGFDELIATSDVISVHTPLTRETKHLIGAEALAKMKRGVLLINAARGGVVDEQALVAALHEGKLGGAALDVFETEPPGDHPLLQFDNVIATPHLGASTLQAQLNVAIQVAEQIIDFLDRGVVQNVVN